MQILKTIALKLKSEVGMTVLKSKQTNRSILKNIFFNIQSVAGIALTMQ